MRIDKRITLIEYCFCRVTIEVSDIRCLRIHQATLMPVASSCKTQVLPLQMCSEAHHEIWLRRAEIIIVCSTSLQETITIYDSITIIWTVFICYLLCCWQLEDTDRLTNLQYVRYTTHRRIQTSTCSTYRNGIFIKTIPKFLHLTPVLSVCSTYTPLPILSTDRSKINHRLNTLVLKFTYITGVRSIACLRSQSSRDNLIFGCTIIVSHIEAQTVAKECTAQTKLILSCNLRLQ